mgnify:CR=1 FL=1
MAIKLYKSQLQPTTESSNVMNRNRVSMSEAASIGNAWKGMVKSGELLYAKHQDIKTDNEILEKSKEVMNGGENFTGLSETTLNASQMKDPDAAGKLYNDEWQNIFDNVNGSLSGKQAQRKFKSFMTKQNLKDVNAIKTASTTNMINSLRVNTLDKIETLKKSVIFGTSLESKIAAKELEVLLEDKKTSDIFGNTLEKVVKTTNNEIAFTGYKKMPYTQKDEALAAAEKDKRITAQDLLKLENHFNSEKSSTNLKNVKNINQIEENMKMGFTINTEEFANMEQIANDIGDNKSLLKIEQIKKDYPIYQQLSQMSKSEIENRKNILVEYKNKQARKGEGMELDIANNLEITKKYLSQLTSDLNKDLLATAHDKGIITLNEIGFQEMLSPGGKIEDFVGSINERIAIAKTASSFYNHEIQFFTSIEQKQIKDAFNAADTKDEIIQISSIFVKGFGADSDIAFKQITKDNTVLSTIGGLTIMNDGIPGANADLVAEGFLISKNEELKNIYKIKTSDTGYLSKVAKYQKTFLHNEDTFNNIIEAANYIYMAQLRNTGKTTNDFNANNWEKAFVMASGGLTSDVGAFGTNMFTGTKGGFDNDTRGNQVHISTWLENGSFSNVVKRLEADENLWLKASSNGKNAIIGDGSKAGEEITLKEIFKEEDPYFVSVGNGKYRIAMGEDPTDPNGEPEYLMSSDSTLNKELYFIININNIRAEIETGLD